MRRGCAVLVAVLIIFSGAARTLAYLKFGISLGDRQLALKWTRTPVRYFVSDRGTVDISPAQLEAALTRAFATWEAVPTGSISYVFGGFTSAAPGEDDGRSTLGFLSEPTLDRVLASTSYLIDGVTGELLESDIFFNSSFTWSVAAAGERNRWDVESIALHEIGHLSGLGHSAIGETEGESGERRVVSIGAVMFPIALGTGDVSLRTLRSDDVAGISDVYPAGRFTSDTGSISGRVTRLGGGVFGAHVLAFDIARGSLVGNFTLGSDGQFAIAGLRPGPHLIRVEPIDDADVESFFEPEDPVDLGFAVKYVERLVVVPRGGDSGAVDIAVVAK
jgi:matrixin